MNAETTAGSPEPDAHTSQFAMAERICDDLLADGLCVIDGALPEAILAPLYQFLQDVAPERFKIAGVGADAQYRIDNRIRGDRIRWLTERDNFASGYLAWMTALQVQLNRRLFLGLQDYEAHLARYPVGAVYKRHLDAFGKPGSAAGTPRMVRRVTTVTYLNRLWREEDGGELCIYADQESDIPIRKVQPLFGRLVIFLSDEFPHEVQPGAKERWSIAGWFRVAQS